MLDEFFNLAYVRNWKQAVLFFLICSVFFASVMALLRILTSTIMPFLGYNDAEVLQRSWLLVQRTIIVLGPFFSFLILRAKKITYIAMIVPLIGAYLLSWFGVPGAMIIPAFLTTRKVGKSS